ncbi:hypothetical protein TBLA_0C06360 [Henningerozyma blattae CBS 6284]|uniref:Reverse transcriptase domain-containing protein n=1 Tax=Henningerozyma blattae (strain ATCC 34711 / CBS 6284 / DSM 70876 / NBRC 10599 / NRRL Y-10934 / UCD 77-7) TaxID=1071380 RepID=I2H229_HENB6|nr:hypothetical protein TBLA_0C06360 [Tetrapisispora blattae CBS 6284]CCH60431.1 hypothetical protein TBLA_0C06360 [Tetrapisispora blattae CBS 6284]
MFCFVYLDDILISSKDKKSHLQDIRKVLQILKKENLVCKKKKCHFLQESVEFLGFRLGKNGIMVQQEKIRAVKEMPTPNTIKSAQSFLGMVNYYRNFIPQCSLLSKPIIEFISKKCDWSKKQDQAVITLKQKLCSAPVLVSFIPGDEYRLSTDASTIALGGGTRTFGTTCWCNWLFFKNYSSTLSGWRNRIVVYHSKLTTLQILSTWTPTSS